MREFRIDLKYITNKEVMCVAIINCIYTAINEETDRDLSGSHDYKVQRVIEMAHDIMGILTMNNDNSPDFGRYSGLETIVDAKCFHNIEESVKAVEEVIKEQIVINLVGIPTTHDIMQFVPTFNENKILIKMPVH